MHPQALDRYSDYLLCRAPSIASERPRMNEHAGLGSLLSVLIVVGFTMILHEAERSAQVTAGPALIVTRAESRQPNPTPPEDRHAAISGPDVDMPEPPPIAPPSAPPTRVDHIPQRSAASVTPPLPPPIAPPIPTRPQPSIRTVRARSAPATPPTPAVMPAPPVAQPVAARSSVTVAEPGERLIDVATRVYGTSLAVEELWRANRDRLANRDAPLVAGWLLRTP